MPKNPPMDPNVQLEGYKPPESAEELLERYASGERYFRFSSLEGADFRGAALSHINLTTSSLAGACFRFSRLFGARFGFADLRNADFIDALLIGADLSGSTLTLANFQGADLSLATLNATDVFRVNFSRALFKRTLLLRLELSEAYGLREANHISGSEVSASTILSTAAGLAHNPANQGAVENFFRGCGLSEDDISYFRSLIGRPIEFFSCFISYTHADKPFARRLHGQLQAQGIRCWLDEHDIKPGDRIARVIDDAIRVNDRVLLCCSETSLSSWWVNDELEKTLAKERRERRDILIPLDLDGYLHQWDGPWASQVQARYAPSFDGWETDNDVFEKQFEKVVEALRADDGIRGEPLEPKP